MISSAFFLSALDLLRSATFLFSGGGCFDFVELAFLAVFFFVDLAGAVLRFDAAFGFVVNQSPFFVMVFLFADAAACLDEALTAVLGFGSAFGNRIRILGSVD